MSDWRQISKVNDFAKLLEGTSKIRSTSEIFAHSLNVDQMVLILDWKIDIYYEYPISSLNAMVSVRLN